ncbi:MAG: TonB-dependent receptor [Filomicrobium sp.]
MNKSHRSNWAKSSRIPSSRLAGVAGAAGALLLTTSAAVAQQPQELEGIIISGGLTPVQAANFGRASTVISSDQLEQRGIKQIADALRQVPGLAVSRSGGAGGLTEIRVRGSESNHVLVLIDGIETANSSGGFDFGAITADEIERIEVIRGPQSALYGSAALAGIINIVTKRGIRNGYRAGATAEVGTPGSKAFSGLVRGGNNFLDVAMSISHRDDEGWNPAGEDGESDGLENTAFATKVTADITKNLDIQGVFRWSNDTTEFDDTAFGCGNPSCYVIDGDNTIDRRERIAGLTANYKMLDGALVHSPFVHYADSESETIDGFGTTLNDAITFKYGYKGAFFFGSQRQHSLAGLIEQKEEKFENSFANGKQQREQTNYAAEYKGNITPDLFFQAGVRYDDNELFDDALTWSTSASYRFAATNTRVHASVGRGIVNPSFFEQFGTIFSQFLANPNLTPEESLGWDVGVEQKLFGGKMIVDVTYFNATLTDEITTVGVFDPLSNSFVTTPINLDGESDRQGIEVQATVMPLPGLLIGASYTYLDATEPDGTPEVRRPENAFGLNVAYTFLDDRATIGADVTYNGGDTQRDFSDASFSSPKVSVEEYFVVDLNASYKVSDEVKVYGVLNNAFDEDYEEVLGFRARPRQAYVGVKVGY